MPKSKTAALVPVERITDSILILRSHKVLLDANLAALYGVPTGVLVQTVKRNIERFPEDFMFQLTAGEWAALRSQFVISNDGRGGRRYAPYAFTEQGVAMLSSVLKSTRAIAVNIEIMRTFVRMRKLLASNKELAQKLAELERKFSGRRMSCTPGSTDHISAAINTSDDSPYFVLNFLAVQDVATARQDHSARSALAQRSDHQRSSGRRVNSVAEHLLLLWLITRIVDEVSSDLAILIHLPCTHDSLWRHSFIR